MTNFGVFINRFAGLNIVLGAKSPPVRAVGFLNPAEIVPAPLGRAVDVRVLAGVLAAERTGVSVGARGVFR